MQIGANEMLNEDLVVELLALDFDEADEGELNMRCEEIAMQINEMAMSKPFAERRKWVEEYLQELGLSQKETTWYWDTIFGEIDNQNSM